MEDAGGTDDKREERGALAHLGNWEPFVREVARGNYDQARAIEHWPLDELLLAYLELVKEQLREEFRHRQLLYQVRTIWGGSKEQPPAVPDLLRSKPEP